MGSPPPEDFPPPATPATSSVVTANPSASLGAQEEPAGICGLSFPFPDISFGLGLTISIPGFPPALPLPWLSIKLSCDPKNPIDVTGGLPFGAGRAKNNEPDPDLDEDSA